MRTLLPSRAGGPSLPRCSRPPSGRPSTSCQATTTPRAMAAPMTSFTGWGVVAAQPRRRCRSGEQWQSASACMRASAGARLRIAAGAAPRAGTLSQAGSRRAAALAATRVAAVVDLARQHCRQDPKPAPQARDLQQVLQRSASDNPARRESVPEEATLNIAQHARLSMPMACGGTALF